LTEEIEDIIFRTVRPSLSQSYFPRVRSYNAPVSSILNLESYESMLQLEDVPVGTSPEVVSSFPMFPYAGENLAEKNCTICLDDFKKDIMLRRLLCLHVFHQECIDEWLKKSKKCPICNSDVTTKNTSP